MVLNHLQENLLTLILHNFINNNMNYLSNYYKNLAEQLQEKVNHLTQLIENETLTPDNHDGPDAGSKGSADEVAEWALKASLEKNPGFHDDIVHALSYHLGTAHPHVSNGRHVDVRDPGESVLDLRRRLHGSAPTGGYKTFDHAFDTLGDIVTDGAHHGRNDMYNAINDGIGFDEEGDNIVDHTVRQDNMDNVLAGIRKKSIGTVNSFQAQRGS